MKKCQTCNIIKKINNFYNRSGSSDGKSSQCKECILNQYNKRSNNREYVTVQSKKCVGCKEEKDIKFFGVKKDSSDGYMTRCKKCWNVFSHKNAGSVTPGDMKVCSMCKKSKEISNFWNKKQNPDGKDNKCSTCWKKRQ